MKTQEVRVRLPKEMVEALKDQAAKESRSLTKQVEHILKQTAEAWRANK